MYGLELYICKSVASLLTSSACALHQAPQCLGPEETQMFQSMREWVRRLATTLIINERRYNDNDYNIRITLFNLNLSLNLT